jgi:hypothetical protein
MYKEDRRLLEINRNFLGSEKEKILNKVKEALEQRIDNLNTRITSVK